MNQRLILCIEASEPPAAPTSGEIANVVDGVIHLVDDNIVENIVTEGCNIKYDCMGSIPNQKAGNKSVSIYLLNKIVYVLLNIFSKSTSFK